MHLVNEVTFVVWVGGKEVNDYCLSKQEAEKLAQQYKDDGHDDVFVENTDWVAGENTDWLV